MIEAQEMLKELSVQDYPHMKPQARQKLHRGLKKSAYPSMFEEKRHVTIDMLKARGAGNG